MYRDLQLVLVGLIAVVFGLSALSRQFPHVGWLHFFRHNPPRFSEEETARRRQRANVHTGMELVLIGVLVPMGYAALTVMMFNDFTAPATAVVLLGSVCCIGLGVTVIRRSRRR